MRGSIGAGLMFWVILGSSTLGQALAPPQPRESRFRAPAARVGPAYEAAGAVNDAVSTLGNPLPTPLGIGPASTGVYSTTVLAPGMNVQIPGSAEGAGARMLVVPNADGGQTAFLYNPGSGSVVEYIQTMNVGRLGQGPRYGQQTSSYFNAGSGTQMGVFGGATNVTTDPLTGAFRGVDSGIPAINAARPSYDYKANAPQSFPTPAPTFGGTGGGAVGVGTSNPINVSSPAP